MSIEQPDKVYRYQGFNELSIDALCHDKLFFSDPSAFNDPLDCQPSVESDSDINVLRNILSKLIERRIEAETISSLSNAKISGVNAVSHAKKIACQIAHSELENIEYSATNPEYEVSLEEVQCNILTCEIQKELLKQYDRGICCFTSTQTDPLLWSHYGDQHRGICVGYDLNRDPKPNFHKVIYGGNRIVKTSLIAKAVIEESSEFQNILDRDVLLRKALSWKYEEEWRLLGKRGIQDSILALKDVTFGLRCPASIRHTVISALMTKANGIDFYEIYQVKGSFFLKKRLVEIEDLHDFPRTARSGIEIFGPIRN